MSLCGGCSTLNKKAAFIAQARSGNLQSRTMEDLDSMQLSATQCQALASGNPLLKERVEVEANLARSVSLQTAHGRKRQEAVKGIREANVTPLVYREPP